MEAAGALASLIQHDTLANASVDIKSMTTPEPKPLPDNNTIQQQQSTENDENKSDQKKRFIPEHKKPDAAITFPEKLMSMMNFAQDQDIETFCVAWLPDGKSFVIRNPDEFTRKVLPNYFKATKFSSFTRKLYRWGFRQVNRGIGPDDPIIFGNEFFQRDHQELMTKMRSITAASTRKQEQSNIHHIMAQKRALECMDVEQNHKRILLDQMIMQQQQKVALNQNMFPSSGMNLTSALRPNLGNSGFNGMGGMKNFDMGNMGGNMKNFDMGNMGGGMKNFDMGNMGGGMKNFDMGNMGGGMKNFDMGNMGGGMKNFDMGNMGGGMKNFDMGNMGGMKSFNMFGQGMSHNSNSLMNAAFPSISQGGLGNSNNQFDNAASTADIVNAAINALRYAP